MQMMRIRRSTAALGMLLVTALPLAAQQTWPRSTPAEQGLAAAPLEQLTTQFRGSAFGHMDRFVVIRNGFLVVDERFPRDYAAISRGKANALGCGVDACSDPSRMHQYNYLHPDFHPYWQRRDVHSLQSVTKSVTATLIGIAIARGEIRGVDMPLLTFFGAYDLSKIDPRLRAATLQDLLTMRSGIEWHEQDRPLDMTNTTLQLEYSEDWIRFTLAQPMDAEPGKKWVYSSGGSALMSEVVRSATNQHVDRYAQQHLFGPLGITDHHWKKTPTGHPDTEGGLYLEALDLAKIGQLYLDDGVWGGKRLLPTGWAKEATTAHVARINEDPASPGYGYQWWVSERRGREVWSGRGFGGQFLIVIPSLRVVAVTNSWNVFGDQVPGSLNATLDALLTAAGVTAPDGL
jgi:CubicO group peptidase (beta-lactamase class C family)